MVEIGPFNGFGPDAAEFLAGLAADNSKAYFDAHRPIYDTQLVAPMKALVVVVGEMLADRVSPTIGAEPSVGKSLFRINRDLRFSKDPTPYHPYVDAVFWDGDSPRSSPGFILRIDAESVVVGAGVLGLTGARLDRYRGAVVDDATGGALVRIIDDARAEIDGLSLSDPTRARVPKGYPRDHPRADLLRRDGLHLRTRGPLPHSFTTPHFADWLVDRYVVLAPFERWLVGTVEERATAVDEVSRGA